MGDYQLKQNKLLNFLFVSLVILSLSAMTEVSAKEVAPNFTLTDIDGNEFSLSGYRGKIVLLDFFRITPSCPPCIEAIPHLKSLHETFGEDLVIISISVGSETVNDLQQFRDNYEISWTIAKDTVGVSNDYNIQYIPTLVIVDQEGYIRHRHVGLTEESVLLNEINAIPRRPIAKFSYSPPSPRLNMIVSFDASASLPGWNGTHNTPIVNYAWGFGDGNQTTSSQPILTHKYSADGDYSVTLKVTDTEGRWNTAYEQITVNPWTPIANFEFSPPLPNLLDVVTFDASSSLTCWNGIHNVPIVDYAWDFGDGEITTVPNPVITHKYTTNDTYSVSLTVTCAYDPKLPTTKNSTTKTITVSMEPTNGDASPGFPAWLAVMLILFVAGIVLYVIFLKWGS